MKKLGGAVRRWFSRRSRTVLTGIAVIIVGLLVWTNASPWPSAMLIRSVFEQGGAATVTEMNRHLPDSPIDARLDVAAPGLPSFDVFRPGGAKAALPTVLWIHGGAWISGDKRDVAPYLRILAAKGYTTIGLDYTVGPEAIYPTAVTQLNDTIGYLLDHAEEFGIDPDRVVLAGDSAGAQLASELAVLATNPEFEQLTGIDSALSASQLRGTVLNCGVYEMDGMAKLTGIGAWGFKVALWAYTGTKDWSQEPPGALMSSLEFATEDFPTTYISGGNADPLTLIQSVPMADRLKSLGVNVTRVFYATDHEPALAHEYQFHLDGADAKAALKKTITFLDTVTSR
ncbi:MAG TPA: alpha/beta hydrolase [Pseudolysinimonas sp.]|nr:alpha/beta hydrolase [Pseudolysinimonas sp.]